MINKLLVVLLISSTAIMSTIDYKGGSLAPVVVSGALIATQGIEIKTKYKRENCPICKGKGWILSGDKLHKSDCDACEPEDKKGEDIPDSVTHDPIIIRSDDGCKTGKCKPPGMVIKRKP